MCELPALIGKEGDERPESIAFRAIEKVGEVVTVGVLSERLLRDGRQ